MQLSTFIRSLSIVTALASMTIANLTYAEPTVQIQTNKGIITLELDNKAAPKTVANFVRYAQDGFYEGTIFHRVIPGFMIQGGGMNSALAEKPTRQPIENEAKNGLKNVRGTIAMARRGAPNSATSQFFINHQNNSALNYPSPDGFGYAVFGKVTSGMDVVDKIAQTPTKQVGIHENVPIEPVVIEKITISPQN